MTNLGHGIQETGKMLYRVGGAFRFIPACVLVSALAAGLIACGSGGPSSTGGATPVASGTPTPQPSLPPRRSPGPLPTPPLSGVGVMIQRVTAVGQAGGRAIGQEWQGSNELPAVRADVGWTGITHRLAILQGAGFTAALLDCDGEDDPLCDINASVEGDFFGAPSPLAGGGVGYCVTLVFVSDVTGTINLKAGDIVELADLEARVFAAPRISEPCPACLAVGPVGIGEPGVCSGGARDGLPCTVEGLGDSAFGDFRATSTQCLPNPAAEIGRFDVKVRPATTGRVSFSAGLPCTAPGYANELCWCDTCAGGTEPGAPCSSDFDCGKGGVCGGRRCIGGEDDGERCSSGTDCDSSVCRRRGSATRPNMCNGGSTDCILAEDGIGGVCASGPQDSVCAGAPYRGCSRDDDCPALDCTPRLRSCFRNPIERTGVPDPVVGGVAHPTLVGAICFAPTVSAAVNEFAGFPGPMAFIWPSEITVVR